MNKWKCTNPDCRMQNEAGRGSKRSVCRGCKWRLPGLTYAGLDENEAAAAIAGAAYRDAKRVTTVGSMKAPGKYEIDEDGEVVERLRGEGDVE